MVQETYTGTKLDQNTKIDLLDLAIRSFADYFSDYFHCPGDPDFAALMGNRYYNYGDVDKTNKNLTRLVEALRRISSTRVTDKRINRKIREAVNILNSLNDAHSIECQILALQEIDNAMINAKKEQGWGLSLPRMFMHKIIGYSKFHEKLKIIYVKIFEKNFDPIFTCEYRLRKELKQKKETLEQRTGKYFKFMEEHYANVKTKPVTDTPEIRNTDEEMDNTKKRISSIEVILRTIENQERKYKSYISAPSVYELPSRSLGR